MRVNLLRIRRVYLIGARRWCQWLNDPRTARYLESRGHWTEERLRVWVTSHWRQPGTRLYAICLEDKPVGTLKLENVQPGGWANLGLMIGEASARSCGIGRRAIERACAIAKRAGCCGVWAGMREANLAPRHAFLGAGFSAEGVVPPPVVEAVRAWLRRPIRLALWRRL